MKLFSIFNSEETRRKDKKYRKVFALKIGLNIKIKIVCNKQIYFIEKSIELARTDDELGTFSSHLFAFKYFKVSLKFFKAKLVHMKF